MVKVKFDSPTAVSITSWIAPTVMPYQAAARYGITVGAIQDVIETAVGESNLTLTIEGRQRFPVRVRYAPEYRASAQALGSVLVTAPNGAQIPLAQLADIRSVSGPSMIS